MKSFRIFVATAICVLIAIILFVWRVPFVRFFSNIRVALVGSTDPSFDYRSFEKLHLEYQALSAKCATSTFVSDSSAVSGKYRVKEVKVFSLYPFNDYASISINAGSDDGLKEGMPVLAAPEVLLGKIKTVSRTKSEVQTIFDPSWKSTVSVGTGRIKAVLVGGAAPYVDLLPKNASTTPGDVVLNLAPEFPMDLFLGKAEDVREGSNALWLRATIDPLFRFEDIDRVLVVMNFP